MLTFLPEIDHKGHIYAFLIVREAISSVLKKGQIYTIAKEVWNKSLNNAL